MDISRLLIPNAVAAGEAVKAGRENDFSKLASRLRDPSVTLDQHERDWLAGYISGDFKLKRGRRRLAASTAFRTYAHWLRCMRRGDQPDHAYDNVAVELGIVRSTVIEHVKLMKGQSGIALKIAAEVACPDEGPNIWDD